MQTSAAMQVANFRRGMDWALILTGVPLVLATRALNIFPLAWLLNRREHRPASCVACPACRPCSQSACIQTDHSHSESILAILQQLVSRGCTIK